MKLRGIEFGHVFNASGARGFVGEGYWFHRFARPFGLSWEGSTLVTKTTTLFPREGNMPLDTEGRPMDLFPRCIVVKAPAGVVLNAVGLSGPGAHALANRWRAELPSDPVVISMAYVKVDEVDRLGTFARGLADVVGGVLRLRAKDTTAIQVNVSCPNTGEGAGRRAAEEATAFLDAFAPLDVPAMVKINALTPVTIAARIAEHPGCDALVVSNTIPWGQLPERIDWKGLFGSNVSPLARFGGGGLSGAPLLSIVADWLIDARGSGIKKPIVGGGGILTKADADVLIDAGVARARHRAARERSTREMRRADP